MDAVFHVVLVLPIETRFIYFDRIILITIRCRQQQCYEGEFVMVVFICTNETREVQ
jgi:hypothetical protein